MCNRNQFFVLLLCVACTFFFRKSSKFIGQSKFASYIDEKAHELGIVSNSCSASNPCNKNCTCADVTGCYYEPEFYKNLYQCPSCRQDSDCISIFDSCISVDRGRRVCEKCALYAKKISMRTCEVSNYQINKPAEFNEWLGPIIFERKSNYSTIRVRERRTYRFLIFVDSEGNEQYESVIDVSSKHDPKLYYVFNFLFSFLYLPIQEKVLVLGLGGASIPHFYQHFYPNTYVDVVEIDSNVVQASKTFFGAVETSKIKIHTMDAYEFLLKSTKKFDVIYVDAFLNEKSSMYTNRMKSLSVLQMIEETLSSTGIAAFNVMTTESSSTGELSVLRHKFPKHHTIWTPSKGNIIFLGMKNFMTVSKTSLKSAAFELDRTWKTSHSFSNTWSFLDK